MAFLGDFGKVLGLGDSKTVLGGIGSAVGSFFGGTAGAEIGGRLGSVVGGATSSLDRGGTADQPLEQSALPTPRPEDLLTRQETARSGTFVGDFQAPGPVFTTQDTRQAGLGSLAPIITQVGGRIVQGARSLFNSPVATGVGTGVAFGLGENRMNGSRMPTRLIQSRKNKARVRQLVNFLGIEGAADFLSQSMGINVMPSDVVNLLLRTFRNDGAYITKAQVRNLRRTTNRFKSLEKQVKEATSMGRTTRRAPARRTSATTLIKN